jgi:hypothetical protein
MTVLGRQPKPTSEVLIRYIQSISECQKTCQMSVNQSGMSGDSQKTWKTFQSNGLVSGYKFGKDFLNACL